MIIYFKYKDLFLKRVGKKKIKGDWTKERVQYKRQYRNCEVIEFVSFPRNQY